MKNKNKMMNESRRQCIHCHQCQECCEFLKKYQLDIGDREALESLAYHCFLCGKCELVCPVHIDGRQEVLDIRKGKVREKKVSLRREGYQRILHEKSDYIYRNYRHQKGRWALFPGCNFPSFYPKTMKILSEKMEKMGVGTVHDCCGKPIAELGMEEAEQKLIKKMKTQMESSGITKMITVCPNCYYYLKEHLDTEVVSIYELLEEPQWRESIIAEQNKKVEKEARVYIPCPDWKGRHWYRMVQKYLPDRHQIIEDIQCCGLGGCAAVCEKDLAKNLAKKIKEYQEEPVYTYCASCAGNFSKVGQVQIKHVLVELLGTKERPKILTSFLHRKRTKYI
ncbi:MAG: (Fe-S)-binding protein [Eubacteriales bacterium]|nr:(Fe-S)-binding protein [Eubacteriales bacterium]